MDSKCVLLLVFLAGICSAQITTCPGLVNCIAAIEDAIKVPKNMDELCQQETGVLNCLHKELPACILAPNIEEEIMEIVGTFINDTCDPETDLYKALKKDFGCLKNITNIKCDISKDIKKIAERIEDHKNFDAFCIGEEAVGKCIDIEFRGCANAKKEIKKEYVKLSDFITTKNFDGKKCNGAGIQMMSYAVLITAFLVATKSIWF